MASHIYPAKPLSPPRLGASLARDVSLGEKYLTYGAGTSDDYPERIGRLIELSPTASQARRVLASFLAGQGFANAEANAVVVGRDNRGKPLTVRDIVRAAAWDVATYHGYYLRVQPAFEGVSYAIKSISTLPFARARFSIPDSEGLSAFVYEKRGKRPGGRSEETVKYGIFTPTLAAVTAQNDAEASGQCYFEAFDHQYTYPLSPFDAVVDDMDADALIASFRANTLNDGFLGATFIGMAPAADEAGDRAQERQVRDMLGARGARVMVYTLAEDAQGKLDPDSAITVQSIEPKLDKDIVLGWENSVRHQIRRAAYNMPVLFTDSNELGGLGATSGEAYRVAVGLYNELTRDLRDALGESLAELLRYFPNPLLRDLGPLVPRSTSDLGSGPAPAAPATGQTPTTN